MFFFISFFVWSNLSPILQISTLNIFLHITSQLICVVFLRKFITAFRYYRILILLSIWHFKLQLKTLSKLQKSFLKYFVSSCFLLRELHLFNFLFENFSSIKTFKRTYSFFKIKLIYLTINYERTCSLVVSICKISTERKRTEF